MLSDERRDGILKLAGAGRWAKKVLSLKLDKLPIGKFTAGSGTAASGLNAGGVQQTKRSWLLNRLAAEKGGGYGSASKGVARRDLDALTGTAPWRKGPVTSRDKRVALLEKIKSRKG